MNHLLLPLKNLALSARLEKKKNKSPTHTSIFVSINILHFDLSFYYTVGIYILLHYQTSIYLNVLLL